MSVLGLLALQGCSQPSLNPIDWYHQLQGGAIAEQRPPPPNANDPYPNLGTVPKPPEPVDPAARGKVFTGLVADRANAQYAAGLNPLPTPPGPGTRPVAPAPLPTGDETSGATLQGAAGPPPRVGPLGPPQPALPNTPATLPAVPDAPPPPPVLAGIPGSTKPSPAPATPPPPAPPPAPVAAPGAPVLVAFPPGSATLPVESLGALKVLTQSRGARAVSIVGYGEASGSDANAQAAALPLALARARAVAANLLAAGVPSSSLRVTAEAQGHGAAARLMN